MASVPLVSLTGCDVVGSEDEFEDSQASGAQERADVSLRSGSSGDCDCPGGCRRIRSRELELLDEADGWEDEFRSVWGGDDAWLYTVQEENAEEQLRQALRSDCRLWIKFDFDGVIKLDETLRASSNKVLDGRGHEIRIDTYTKIKSDDCENPDGEDDQTITGLEIKNAENVIVTNLEFVDNFKRWEEDCEGSDAITVKKSKRVWIHHNKFKRWADGGVDVLQGSKVKMSWNDFKDIHQAVMIQDSKVEFHHNRCRAITARCPKAVGNARVHAYNNVIEDWNDRAIVTAVENGQLLFEYGIFVGEGDVGKHKDGAKLQIDDNLELGRVDINEKGKVSDDVADGLCGNGAVEPCEDRGCFERLLAAIRAEAGATW